MVSLIKWERMCCISAQINIIEASIKNIFYEWASISQENPFVLDGCVETWKVLMFTKSLTTSYIKHIIFMRKNWDKTNSACMYWNLRPKKWHKLAHRMFWTAIAPKKGLPDENSVGEMRYIGEPEQMQIKALTCDVGNFACNNCSRNQLTGAIYIFSLVSE